MGKLIFLFVLALHASTASAYIPKFWMILSKTADNRGKGPYRLVQEVQFQHLDEPIVVVEEWTVVRENQLMLRATGKGLYKDRIRYQAIYDGTTKSFVNESGARAQAKLGVDWFEDFFWFTNSDRMKVRMYNMKMIPREALAKPPQPRHLSQVRHTQEIFVRLARTNGKVAYAIGEPPTNTEVDLPTLWIEQDGFNVLKLKIPGVVTIRADGYRPYGENLQFAKQREVMWGDRRVIAQTIDLRAASSTALQLDPKMNRVMIDDAIVQEFYSRFR